ncbi:MAG: PorP/SprF family type IX secretion system membrane protein [Saprospiraceae bacterium]|nr:PorP/SprF family type IX secretion system membrane protein [Saprospiraceae bacterium]
MYKIPQILSCVLLVLSLLRGFGQQTPLSTLIYKDKYRINPAYAGLEGTLFASGIYRNQWQNFEGNPQTMDISFNCPLYRIGSGMGITFGQDKLGIQKNHYVKPSINKVWKSSTWLVSIGLQSEFYWFSLNSNAVRTPQGEYQGGNLDHKDNQISNLNGSINIMDLGLSCFVQRGPFELGIAIEKLLESKKDQMVFPWQNNRTVKGFMGAQFDWFSINFIEQIVVLSDFKQSQIDFFSGFEYNGNIFGGVHVRGYNGNSFESLGVSFGFSLSKQLKMAYGHEFYMGSIPQQLNGGSQELGIFYNFGRAFGLGKAPKIIHSPRYSD